MTKVYLDMDGVLVDFLRGVNEFNNRNDSIVDWSTLNYKEIGENRRVIDCMNTEGFFRDLPMMSGAINLWRAAGEPYVLTAWPTTANDKERVGHEKCEWITKNFGDIKDRFIYCSRKDKAQYAKTTSPNPDYKKPWYDSFRTDGRRWITTPNILIDDHKDNINSWKEAGGVGILFKDMNQAIKDLELATN